MESLRVNEYGEINIPQRITEMLGAKKGEELLLLKRNGYFIVSSASIDPLDKIRKACEGLATQAGWESDDDIVDFMRELRKERYLQNANILRSKTPKTCQSSQQL
jgi:bifunctional DNA-binding transcriptional regulator/antitoxin component of YhaV-PrlF toxin-antitoxin module